MEFGLDIKYGKLGGGTGETSDSFFDNISLISYKLIY
jgi:hypothetical protein